MSDNPLYDHTQHDNPLPASCEHSDAHEQWLKDRQTSVGGSEAASVMGVNPWQTPLQLYMRKAGLAPDVVETEAMRMGHVMEPVIDQLYRKETGRETIDPGEYAIERRGDHPDMHATLDRLAFSEPSLVLADMVAQYKNVGTHMGKHWDDGIPLYVQVQVQHEMFVSGRLCGSVAALIGGNRFVWDDVTRNHAFCEHLAERCAAFMACVREEHPPEVGADDTDALKLLYPTHDPGKTKELPADLIDLDDELRAAMMDMRQARRRVLACSNKIKAAVGDAERGVLPNGTVYAFKARARNGYTVRPTTIRTLRRRA